MSRRPAPFVRCFRNLLLPSFILNLIVHPPFIKFYDTYFGNLSQHLGREGGMVSSYLPQFYSRFQNGNETTINLL